MKHTLFRNSFLDQSIQFVIGVRSTHNLIDAKEKSQLKQFGHGSLTLQAHDLHFLNCNKKNGVPLLLNLAPGIYTF